MAIRPIFIPTYKLDQYVRVESIEFTWFPGLSISQKQKSIESLHQSAISQKKCKKPLEVSSKSPLELGKELSAFNLGINIDKGRFTVETYFQSSKVFKSSSEHSVDDGPYIDLLYGKSINAKKDPRILERNALLINFQTPKGDIWGLQPKTAFYDWVYINTLQKNPNLIYELDRFDSFTDIEFNPEKSWNCQAYALALFKSLKHQGLLEKALSSKENFLKIINLQKEPDAHCQLHMNKGLFD